MAENTKLTSLELNGVRYGLGKSIYAELDMSLERFVELLGRDFYCPTLASAPTSSTVTYTDTDESVNTFQVGQPCRWQEGGAWRLAVCTDNTGSAATWYVLPTKVSELTNDKGYLTEHQDISHLATTSALNSGLSGKVDKVNGKQLSTEDFTTVLKNKLEGLNNYDDATITNAVNSLRDDFDTLVSGDASTAIESFNEIIAFLEGVQDTGTLEGIVAGISQEIAKKQDVITDLTSIRSGAALGATAIQEHQSLEGYTKDADLAVVAKSGSYNDLSNKPTIPSAVTESTVSGWGFTKNAGTITGIKMNGASKGTSGVVDLGTVITSHQDISGKLDASTAAATYATKAEIPTDYLTEENVVDYIYAPVINHGTSDTTLAITPNEYHVWGSVSSLTLTLANPSDATVYNEYMFEFVSPSTATTLSLPSDIKWVSAPDIQPNMIYQVSIVNGLGVIGGFSNE